MAKTRPRPKGARKVPKSYRLAPAKVAAAQRILGAATATETIEQALDLVVFRQELIDGTRHLLGLSIGPPESA
jgi:hypothetical protein